MGSATPGTRKEGPGSALAGCSVMNNSLTEDLPYASHHTEGSYNCSLI